MPDSLNNKVWLRKLSEEQKRKANTIRKAWHANSLSEIALKSTFLAKSNLPFRFTCVHKSIGNLRDDFDKETALEQYRIGTSQMEVYNDRTTNSKN